MATKKKSARQQVIDDERTAEEAWQLHLAEAAAAARKLAEDEARSEVQRKAAEEAGWALHRIELARKRAEQEQEPEAVKKTFWQSVTSFLTGNG